MFDTVCTLPLTSDLFCQTIHPSEPILATGLASGHVSIYRLPATGSDDNSSSAEDHDGAASVASNNGLGQIATQWRTRRHEGSCRSLAFSTDGTGLFSAGADGVVKYADTETGRVKDKITVPADPATGGVDAPSLMHALNPQMFLLATDTSALHLYDLRVGGGGGGGGGKTTGAFGDVWTARRPAQTHHPHTDYISSLTPLPPTQASTSGFSKQWVSTGGTTLAVTDLRRGVLVRSEDQEELLLSSCIIGGLSSKGTSTTEKVIVGGGAGVLTLWERGQWDDQDERIVVDKGMEKGQGGESLDVLAVLPDGVGPGKTVAVGLGDGRVRFVKIGPNKVVDQVRHDDLEGVVGIGFDIHGRLITGGGSTIKVWHEKVDEDNGAYVEPGKSPVGQLTIHGVEDDDDEADANERDSDESEQEEEEEKQPERKKRKKGGPSGHLNGRAGNFTFSGLD